VHNFVNLNGRTVEAASASLPSLSSAALYGRGVFTTIAIVGREPFLWEKHWTRLSENAAKLNIKISQFTSAEIAASLAELIDRNKVDDGRARITFFDGSPAAIWPFEIHQEAGLLIMTGDRRPIVENFGLTVSPYRVNSQSPLIGLKSCNYLEPLLVLEEAKSRGFDDGLRLDQFGKVTSAATANVFYAKGGKLYTPALSTGCLAGTTREYIIENLACEDVVIGLDELRSADEIFVTSAGIGVLQVGRFEGRQMPRRPHPILDILPFRL
jgi:branched-subunit amino acid aminotransferase/4-amino-4-deoxychorismate lyase